MPPCEAVLIKKAPCYVRLRRRDGSAFNVGSPAIGAEVGYFLEELHLGRSYRFPDAFNDYTERRLRARP